MSGRWKKGKGEIHGCILWRSNFQSTTTVLSDVGLCWFSSPTASVSVGIWLESLLAPRINKPFPKEKRPALTQRVLCSTDELCGNQENVLLVLVWVWALTVSHVLAEKKRYLFPCIEVYLHKIKFTHFTHTLWTFWAAVAVSHHDNGTFWFPSPQWRRSIDIFWCGSSLLDNAVLLHYFLDTVAPVIQFPFLWYQLLVVNCSPEILNVESRNNFWVLHSYEWWDEILGHSTWPRKLIIPVSSIS